MDYEWRERARGIWYYVSTREPSRWEVFWVVASWDNKWKVQAPTPGVLRTVHQHPESALWFDDLGAAKVFVQVEVANGAH